MKKETKFKQTEIGLIPEDWEMKVLSKIAYYVNEKGSIDYFNLNNFISTENLLPNKAGISKISSLPSRGSFTKFNEKDILFSNIRTYFKKLWLAKFKGGCSNDVLVIRPLNNLIDKIFLFYYLSQESFFNYTVVTSRGTKMPRGDKNAIMNFEIRLPPISEQKLIAKILSDLDSKIELLQEKNKILEKIGQALFKHWFVEFEFPTKEGKPYKSSGGKMIDSVLGEIPNVWNLGKLGDLINKVNNSAKAGESLNKKKYIPIDKLSIKKLNIGEYLSYKEAKSSLVLFEKNDILVGAMRVYFHRVNISPFQGVTRTTTFVFRPKRKNLLEYSLFLLNLNSTIDFANQNSRGSTMPYAVWKNSFENMPVIVAADKVLNEFSNLVSPIVEKIRDSIFELEDLKKIRDLLLPKLMTGKIRVKI